MRKKTKRISSILIISMITCLLTGCANGNTNTTAPTPITTATSSPVPATSTPTPVVPTEVPVSEAPAPTEAAPEHVHEYVVDVTAPTCTEYGIESGICECGDKYTVKTDPAGHTMGEFQHRKDSTTEEYGEDAATCALCGYEEVKYLPLATPTVTPEPTATDTPTPTATDTPTPKPTATNTPKPTKKPTSTPTPTATTKPTYTPVPTNTPTPKLNLPSEQSATYSERKDREDGTYTITRRYDSGPYPVSLYYSDTELTVFFNPEGQVVTYDVPHKLSEESLKIFRYDIVNVLYWCRDVQDAWNLLKALGYVNSEPDMQGYVRKSAFYIHANRDERWELGEKLPMYTVSDTSSGERTVGGFSGK